MYGLNFICKDNKICVQCFENKVNFKQSHNNYARSFTPSEIYTRTHYLALRPSEILGFFNYRRPFSYIYIYIFTHMYTHVTEKFAHR